MFCVFTWVWMTPLRRLDIVQCSKKQKSQSNPANLNNLYKMGIYLKWKNDQITHCATEININFKHFKRYVDTESDYSIKLSYDVLYKVKVFSFWWLKYLKRFNGMAAEHYPQARFFFLTPWWRHKDSKTIHVSEIDQWGQYFSQVSVTYTYFSHGEAYGLNKWNYASLEKFTGKNNSSYEYHSMG